MAHQDPLHHRTAIIACGLGDAGLAIARRLAKAGVRLALLAAGEEAGPTRSGADVLRASGADALPHVGDLADPESVAETVSLAVQRFGGVDLCVHAGSAIGVVGIGGLSQEAFDRLHAVTARATFAVVRACLPHLRSSDHAHVLTLAPPATLDLRHLEPGARTSSLLAMSAITLGVARSEWSHRVGANCLWPEGEPAHEVARAAEIVLRRDPVRHTGATETVREVLGASRDGTRVGQEK